MKNKLLVFIGLLFFQYGCASEVGSDRGDRGETESVSSKSSEASGIKLALPHEEGHAFGSSSSSSGSSASDSSSESSESDDSGDSGIVQDKVIDKTWGLKNLLSATPDQDLYRSPLLGLITVGNGTIKKWYGEFTDVPVEQQEAGKPARNKRVFVSETPLEKVTRAFFDVLDNRVRWSVAGSNPMIAFSAEAIGHLAILTQERGVLGTISFLEKGLSEKEKRVMVEAENKKKYKRKQEMSPVSQEEAFVEQWWKRYEVSPKKGANLSNFRKNLTALLQDLKTLQQEQGPEKTKQMFLTLLMAFLVLKDELEGQKNSVYALQDYFKKWGVEFVRDYYTTLEKKAIQKRLAKRSFGTSVKDFEDVVFYLVALAKNDFEFVAAPYTSAFFKETVKGEEREIAHGMCAEATVRSLVNLMLYNPITQRFDIKMLPEGMHLDPLVYDFYFNPEHPRTDPQAQRYYAESTDAWVQVIAALHKKFPEIMYEVKNELAARPQNILLVMNKIFETTVQSFQELGNVLSKDGSQITIETAESEQKPQIYEKKEKWTIAVERDGLPGEDPYEFSVNLELSEGHASFAFDMENIMPLMGKHQYHLLEELQKIYHVELWEIVLHAAAINAVINEETPFQKAIETGYVPLVELLVSHGADIHQVDDDGMGALAHAYQSGSAEMVKFFTDKGLELHADLNTIYDWLFIADKDDALFDKIMASNVTDTGQRRKDFYSTALIACLGKNWVDRAQKLINEGADINFIEVPDEAGLCFDAPIRAAARGCTDEALVNSLIDALEPAGDDKNRAQAYGDALNSVLSKKWFDTAKVLIEKGADVTFYREYPNVNPDLPPVVVGVVLSASTGDDELLMQRVVDKLPVAGENKMLARLYGEALYQVISKQWFDIARILIQKGADVNFYGSYELDGVTRPYGMVLSVSYGNDKQFMQMVLEKLNPAGENKLLIDLYSQALYQVIAKQWFDIAVKLVEKGASLNELNEYMRESLEHYQDSLEKDVQSIEGALKDDVFKLEEVFGEEQQLVAEPTELVHSETISLVGEMPTEEHYLAAEPSVVVYSEEIPASLAKSSQALSLSEQETDALSQNVRTMFGINPLVPVAESAESNPGMDEVD